jgi:creatinine amidohydrolase
VTSRASTPYDDPEWASWTAPELRAFAAADPVVVWPVSAIEQHGPHLPVSTDLVIARGLLQHARALLPEGFPLLVLPEQAVGASLEHTAFPGTLSLGSDTLGATMRDIGGLLARHGFGRLVVLNTHGGNKHTIDQAALELRTACNLLVVKAHSFRFSRPPATGLPEAEWTHGLHGGAVETAMMLHLRPDLVRRDHMGRFPSLGEELAEDLRHVGPEGGAAFAWMAQDLGPEGVVGDAGLATAELGAHLVAHYARVLADILRDAGAFPLDRLRPMP